MLRALKRAILPAAIGVVLLGTTVTCDLPGNFVVFDPYYDDCCFSFDFYDGYDYADVYIEGF